MGSGAALQGQNPPGLRSVSRVEAYSPQAIDSLFQARGLPSISNILDYDVVMYKVVYNTVDHDSNATYASGTLFLPQTPPDTSLSLLSYQHGTTIDSAQVAWRQKGSYFTGLALASSGYALSMPDYLGLGEGPGLHPYIHKQTEATATIDLLRGSRRILDSLQYDRSGRVYLTGYSQGGHATLATAEMLQNELAGEFTVGGAVGMSGPYDVSGVQAAVIVEDSTYPQPMYLPYIFFAYNKVYELYDSPAEFFKAPYDALLPPLFDGSHGADTVNSVMPSIPNKVMEDSVLQAFRTNSSHPLHQALRDNDVYRWRPEAPTLLLYCQADEEVTYRNALVAHKAFQERGAPAVYKREVAANLGHVGCAGPAIFQAKAFIDSLAQVAESGNASARKAATQPRKGAYKLAPNPASQVSRLQIPEPRRGTPLRWSLHTPQGREVRRGQAAAPQATLALNLASLEAGVYLLRIRQGHERHHLRLVKTTARP